MGLKVVTYEDEELSMGRAFLRASTSLMTLPTMGLSLLSTLGKNRLALHDKQSRTIVKLASE